MLTAPPAAALFHRSTSQLCQLFGVAKWACWHAGMAQEICVILFYHIYIYIYSCIYTCVYIYIYVYIYVPGRTMQINIPDDPRHSWRPWPGGSRSSRCHPWSPGRSVTGTPWLKATRQLETSPHMPSTRAWENPMDL